MEKSNLENWIGFGVTGFAGKFMELTVLQAV